MTEPLSSDEAWAELAQGLEELQKILAEIEQVEKG
jgi:hypothetical protein